MAGETDLMPFIRAVAAGDSANALARLAASPALATARVDPGATRESAPSFFLDDVGHYLYAGDTALHIAAAGYRIDLVAALITAGADVRARNRRGAEPLHYAADGNPDGTTWNPPAQADTIARLIAAGADPDATNRSGVAPLHRAVRTRSAPAVRALIEAGADPRLPNKSGSTPLALASLTTGRGGSGSPAARAQQQLIIDFLLPLSPPP